jgi:hypothetical protein
VIRGSQILKFEFLFAKMRPLKFELSIILVFFVIALCSLTFYYVDGDDSITALYHLLGRNPLLQKQFSFYHSGFDYILSFLPANEPIIRIFSISISFAAQIVMCMLMLRLVFQWLGILANDIMAIKLMLIFFLAVPEYLFMGLLYNPTAVAMVFLLAAHLILKNLFVKNIEVFSKFGMAAILISMLFFGFGVTVRWNTGLYGLVIFGDLIRTDLKNKKTYFVSIIWGVLSLICVAVFWKIQGIDQTMVMSVLSYSSDVGAIVSASSLFYKYALSHSFYTPIFLLLTFLGFMISIQKNRPFMIFSLLGLPCFLIFKTIEAKLTVMFHPFLIYWFFIGVRGMVNWLEDRKYFKMVCLFILIAPWIIGLKIYSTSTSWGPGFEINNASVRDSKISVETQGIINTLFERVKVTFFDGMAVPTLEGPRPLGGYAGIFLGGKWRNFVQARANEYLFFVQKAENEKLPIVISGGSAYIETTLYNLGYSTTDPFNNILAGTVMKRTFVHPNRNAITIYHMQKFEFLAEEVQQLLKDDSGSAQLLFFSDYTSVITDILNLKKHKIQKLGPFTLDLTLGQK